MKIKINSNEMYVINLNNTEKMSVQEAGELADRLHRIIKAVSKDIIVDIPNKIKRQGNYTGRSSRTIWAISRDETLKLVRLHYTSTMKDKKDYARANNMEWKELCKKIYGLIKKWNVKPEEVGITKFYKKGEFRTR